MSVETEITVQEQETVDPIVVVYKGQCESLSKRSTLDFEVGQDPADDSWHIKISGNSQAGMYCPLWVSAESVQDIVLGATELTSTSLKPLFIGKSINTAGFLVAVVRALGLVRVSAINSRHHEHVPGSTFAQVVQQCMGGSTQAKSRRKAKEG